jgi:hypothetical protein
MSVNYSMEQSISPVYAFGELTPSGYTRDGGTIEVDLQGTGWGHIIDASTLCEGYTTGNISLDRLCEGCIEGEGTSDLAYPDGMWTALGASEDYERIYGTSICFSCWEVGDTVTLTSAEAGEPWSLGVSAEIYLLEECDPIDTPPQGYVWYKWAASIGEPPWGYDITVSNDGLGAPAPPFIISFSGYVTNPSISVEPNSEIVGSLTVFGSL